MSADFMAIRNIVAVNGSPRAKKGMTDVIVRRFLAGAESAGASTDVLYPAKMKIKSIGQNPNYQPQN
jgi:multimeric flavodoxin WrbA